MRAGRPIRVRIHCLLAAVVLAGGAGGEQRSPHAAVLLEGDSFYLEAGGERQELASVTAYCLECHEGEEILGQTDAAEPLHHSIGPEGSSHPVDLPYPEDQPEYMPRGELDPRVVLESGRLTCLSCHQGEAEDHRPVIPVRQSELCRACHRL